MMMHLFQAQLVAKAPGPPTCWQAWAQGVLQHLPGLSNMPLSEQEVRFQAFCKTREKGQEGIVEQLAWPSLVGDGMFSAVHPVL
jgi:hypothetical protein